MRPTTKRLLSVAVLISAVSAIGFLLAFVFQWPSHFVIGEVEDARVTLQDLIVGTPASIPLVPWAMLIVATLLASSRRWWGAIGVVALCLLGMVFVIGGWGEAFGPPNPEVPRAVLFASGVVYASLGLSLSLCAVLALIDRVRRRRTKAQS
jgi:hypothetical protein